MSLKIAAAIEANQKIASALQSIDDSPLKLISATAASSASALKKIFRVIAGLAVLGVVIKISTMIMAGGPPRPNPRGGSHGGGKKEYFGIILKHHRQQPDENKNRTS